MPYNLDIKIKALEVIERMVADNNHITRKQIEDIYIFSHCALGQCFNKHKEWVDKLNRVHTEIVKSNII